MPENHLFEYAVIRVVPRVEREEFLNTGIILYSRKDRFLQVMYALDTQKLQVLCPEADAADINSYLCAFEQIALGHHPGSTISQLDIASRFRWLTATRSTVIQTSKVHPGFCTDLPETLLRLFNQLVL